MEKTWSLDALYPSFDSEEFQGDFNKLESKIQEVTEWSEENLKDQNDLTGKLEKSIEEQEEISRLLRKLMSYAHLRSATNAKDQDALQYMEKVSKKMTALTKAR